MECFTHPETQAVAVCKSCGKAVCRSCAQDLGHAVVCSADCATDATELNEINKRAKRLYGVGAGAKSRRLPSGVVMWSLFAVFFTGFGIYQSILRHQPDWFLLIFGGLSAIVAFMAYRRARDIGLQC